jgi:hypothetical protein
VKGDCRVYPSVLRHRRAADGQDGAAVTSCGLPLCITCSSRVFRARAVIGAFCSLSSDKGGSEAGRLLAFRLNGRDLPFALAWVYVPPPCGTRRSDKEAERGRARRYLRPFTQGLDTVDLIVAEALPKELAVASRSDRVRYQACVASLTPKDRCSPGDIRLTRAVDVDVGLMARRRHRYGVISIGMPAKLAFGFGVATTGPVGAS